MIDEFKSLEDALADAHTAITNLLRDDVTLLNAEMLQTLAKWRAHLAQERQPVQPHDRVLLEVYDRWVETRDDMTEIGVDASARQVYGLPAITHLEQRLGLAQLQHWSETDPATVVAAIRKAAGTPPDADLEVQALRAHLDGLRAALLAATGYHSRHPIESLIEQAGEELARLRTQVESLSRPLRRLDDAALTHLRNAVQTELDRRAADRHPTGRTSA